MVIPHRNAPSRVPKSNIPADCHDGRDLIVSLIVERVKGRRGALNSRSASASSPRDGVIQGGGDGGVEEVEHVVRVVAEIGRQPNHDDDLYEIEPKRLQRAGVAIGDLHALGAKKDQARDSDRHRQKRRDTLQSGRCRADYLSVGCDQEITDGTDCGHAVPYCVTRLTAPPCAAAIAAWACWR